MTEEHNEELGKICSHCGEKQPLNEFRKRSGRRTGAHVRRGLCRACRQRLSAERLAAARASAADSVSQEAGQADTAASMGRKAGQHDAGGTAANGQAPQGEITEAQTMAAVPRRGESAVEAEAQALWPDHPGHAEVAAAVEIPEASRAEAALSGEPDKKRKRRRRRKKAVAQPGGELKLADSGGGKVAGGVKAVGGGQTAGDGKAVGDGKTADASEAAADAAEVVIAIRAGAGVDADAGAGAGEQPIAADSGEKPKRKRKKAKRKKTGPAKAAAETAEWVGEAERPQAEAGVSAEVDRIGASVEEQQGSAGAAEQAADEFAGKAKRKRKRSKRKGKSKENGTGALSPEEKGVVGHAQAADGVGAVRDSAQVVTGSVEVAGDIGEVVQVSALAAPVVEADADSPVSGEQQEQPGKKRKRKRKKKPHTEQGVAGVDAQKGAVGVEAPSLPETTEVEEKTSSARTKKPKKTKKAANMQGLPEAGVAQVKEPVKSVTVAAVKAEKSVKTEKPKSAARANSMIPPPGYKPIWPDKGATSANLLSLRSVLQEQDNMVRTVGQPHIEEIADLVEEPRKSAELIKREADAFHHTPLRSNRPAKHSNALTRREMQAMREAKLTDHRSRFINHAELVERSKRQQAEGKPTTAGQPVKPVAGAAADVGKDKQTKFEPFDYSVLRPTGKGVIRMRGRTDKGRRWYQEIEYDMAVTLVREQSAVVVNRQTINRLYSNRDFRSYILTRDNYTCYFCGEYGDTIDHLLPRAKGGHSTPLNCVCACNLCNQSKADKDLDVFLKHQKGGSKR